jgi:hypothetical protein
MAAPNLATKQHHLKRLNGRRRTLAIKHKRLRPKSQGPDADADAAIGSELKLSHGMGPWGTVPGCGGRRCPGSRVSGPAWKLWIMEVGDSGPYLDSCLYCLSYRDATLNRMILARNACLEFYKRLRRYMARYAERVPADAQCVTQRSCKLSDIERY